MSTRYKFSEAQAAEIVEEHLGGLGVSALMRKHHCASLTIRRVLTRYGLEPTRARPVGRQPTISLTVALQLRDAYQAGETLDAISERFGLTRKIVRSAIVRAGGKARPRGIQPHTLTPDVAEEIVRRWLNGSTQAQVCEALDISEPTVRRAIRESGSARMVRTVGGTLKLWKQTRKVFDAGYIGVTVPPDHPFACMRRKYAYIPEHRWVMALHLGRPLRDDETVHHINGIKSDNRIENLQLRQGRHGKGVELVCACCGSSNLVPRPLSEG